MNDGCIWAAIILIVLAVPGIPIAIMIANAQQQRRVQTQRRERGARITELLQQLDRTSDSSAFQRELYKLLHEGAIGHFPELTDTGGWFDKVAPILTKLARTDSGTAMVEAYFHVFTFAGGQQRSVLQFLSQYLTESAHDSARLEFLKRLTAAVMASSSVPEAQWLYARTLELVGAERGTPSTKAVALHVGRLAYAAGRPGRTPTIYDEQAIANDIAARIA